MVRINSFALAGLAAVGVAAVPAKRQINVGLGINVGGQTCMTADQAQKVATDYGTLIANYTKELADNALAPNFTDYSESVNTLINTCPQGSAAISLPLLAPTFSSREQFEIGQGQQPNINFQQLNIWPSCNAVIIRWTTNNTAPIPNPKPVVGLISMEVVQNTNTTTQADYPWLIDYVYSEFDSGAWLQNLEQAGICGTPPANSSAINQEPGTSTTTTTAATSTATGTSDKSGSGVGSGSGSVDIVPTTTTAAATATATTGASTGSTGSSSSSGSTGSTSSSGSTGSSSSSGSTGPQTIVVGSDGTVQEVPCDE